MFKKLPSLKDIKYNFFYKDGSLVWKIRPANRVYIGDVADSVHKNTLYKSVQINGERFQSHRIIWKLLTGKEPNGEIDHINGDRSDNRIENLRVVKKHENLKNQKIYKNNKSGTHGIYWSKQKQKWCVQITDRGSQKYCGCYKNLDDAIKSRKNAERKFLFHKNHGRIRHNGKSLAT